MGERDDMVPCGTGLNEKVTVKHRNFEVKYEIFAPACFFYAIFYTFCLYKNMSGITFPFFAAGTAGFLAYCSARCGITWKKKNYFSVLLMMALALSTCMTTEPLIIAVDWIFYFALLVYLNITLFFDTSAWSGKGLNDMCWGTVFGAIGRCFDVFSDYVDKKDKAEEENVMNGETSKKSQLFQAMVGLMVSVPLIIVIVMLLTSADKVFGNTVSRILGDIHISDAVLIVLLICAVYMLSYGVLKALSEAGLDRTGIEPEKHSPAAAAATVLLIAVVYVYFSWIQFSYLFTHGSRLPDGMNYAEYARSGFFQLLAVCLINLVMVAVMIGVFEKNRFMQLMLIIISLCTIVMTCSSTLRMLMYIHAYAMTFLRLAVLWALAGIAWTMALMTVKLAVWNFPAVKVIFWGIAVWYLIFAFSRPGQLVARYDVNAGGAFRDDSYLEDLSLDSVPELVTADEGAKFRAYRGKLEMLHAKYGQNDTEDGFIDMDPRYKGLDGIGDSGYVAEYRKISTERPERYTYMCSMQKKMSGTGSNWRTWNLSRSRAERLIGLGPKTK